MKEKTMFNTSPLLYVFIFAFTLLLTVFIEKKIIPVFTKKAKQPIYEGGPSWHVKKSGTPTMGGVGFLIPVTFICLLLCVPLHVSGDPNGAVSLLISTVFSLLNAGIGILDDLTKLRHKENKGLSAKEKLFLQAVSVVFFLAARELFLGVGTSVAFSFGRIDFGIFYYFITGFILLGIINCANLTDGIDGLASGVAFAAGISIFYVAYGHHSESAIVSAAIIGATVAFLIFNLHPAKIFMGDTGSLFLGALVASAVLNMGNPFAAVSVGGVYVVEGVSVIIQVLVFKTFKKRVFKMSPIHHHLEKSGWSENKICISAILLTLITSLAGFAVFGV